MREEQSETVLPLFIEYCGAIYRGGFLYFSSPFFFVDLFSISFSFKKKKYYFMFVKIDKENVKQNKQKKSTQISTERNGENSRKVDN